MAKLGSKRYMSPKQYEAWQKTIYGRYSTSLKKHHFLLFGLPFIATIFFGSVYLSEFTQIRYDRRDEKVTMLDEEEALSIGQNKRKVDMKEEYYRLQQLGDLDNWEQVRAPRLPGESQNVWDKEK